MSYFTNQTSDYIGATGIYPLFEYIDMSSNNNYIYSSNSNTYFNSQINALKQKDLSHDGSISSINSTIGTIQSEVAANTTAIAGQATQIATLEAATAANTTAIATNTGAIVDLNLNKVNKTSFNSTGVIYMDVAGNVQLSYDNSCFGQYYIVTGNTGVFTLNDTYKNLPTTISSINTNLNDNYLNKQQTSNVLSNTSNTLANYNNLYNKPIIFTQTETSNIFITSNVFNNTSNYLNNYNNLINKPFIYNTKVTSTGIIQSITIISGGSGSGLINATGVPLNFSGGGGSGASGTFNTNHLGIVISVTLTNGGSGYTSPPTVTAGPLNATFNVTIGSITENFLYNNDNYFIGIGTTTPKYKLDVNGSMNGSEIYKSGLNLSNIFTTSNHINTNFYTKTQIDNNIYTKTQSDNRYYTKTQSDTNYYTKTQIDGNFYNKTQIDTSFYTKTQLNDSLTTQKININTSALPSTFTDSFLNVSNGIVVRNTTPADNSTSVGYNDYNMNFGVGDADSFQIIPINGLGSVSQYNLPNLFIGNNYTGIKILKNDIMTFSSKTNLLFNANGTFEVYAARIGLVGEIFTDGHLLAKIPKYFTTSRREVFNGVECLAYDLDLTTLTNKPTINGISHRRFRITLTHSNGRLDFQFAPKVFTISLSTYNGLSAHCIGDMYGTTQLDTVELGFCFFRNTIDKITFLGMTYLYGINPITVYYVIEDLFSA